MTQIKKILLALCLVVLTGCNEKATQVEQGSIFKKSYISLMPEGEPDDLSAFAPLSPTVIAWGNDPIGAGMDVSRFSKDVSAYKELGLKLIASNVWMLTATERFMYDNPEYQEAVCIDIEGEPIVPGWLDSEYKGIRPWWGCTNNPLYRSLIIERASIGIQSGANMLHLDDHLGTCAAASHSGACFCKYCMAGFNAWLGTNYTKKELSTIGIPDLSIFNYAKFVREAGFTNRADYISGGFDKKIPLFNEFLSYQRFSAAEFVRELGELADSIAGKKVPLGVNSWNLDPVQLATSHYADYFSNEVSHYDVEDLIPPFVYLLGNALHKPVFSTGTGEDWIKISQNESPVRIGRWIATAYAFGNYFMYSYNKWGFSEETGTQWYQIPIDMYEASCSFINEHQELFDDYMAYKQVGVIYDNASYRNGDRISREICRELNYKNIPVGLLVLGDEWLKYETPAIDLDQYEYLILPPETPSSPAFHNMIKPYEVNNKLIPWSEEVDIQSIIKSPVQVKGAEKVWAIPRVKENGLSNLEIVIHLLNQDFDEEKDLMNNKIDFQVYISNKLLNDQEVTRVSYYAPGQEVLDLARVKNKEGWTVTVPTLDIWGIIKIE